MREHIVDIGSYLLSSHLDDVLATRSLVSNVAICVHDQQRRLGGLFHFALPECTISDNNPYLYGIPGLALFFEACYGAGMDPGRIRIGLAGGGGLPGNPVSSGLGSHNRRVLLDFLKKERLPIAAASLGQAADACSLRLHIGTGKIMTFRIGCSEEEPL